ncbi:hypothetical protein [Xenorhabdus ishibashii]|uniref:hypothetical protein n=1 Tax=Xenorhabdus ishibashii TaxID=1034471 RepID=UPI00142D5CE6|nr:hypothetical protein [Xenorhabdus ishibashii]
MAIGIKHPRADLQARQAFAHSSTESLSITKEYCPTSFQLSLPFWPQRINHFRCFSYNVPYMDSHMFIILTP